MFRTVVQVCGKLARDDFGDKAKPPHLVDHLTLDTNVVRDYWDQRPRKQSIEQLLELARAGKVDLVVTGYIDADVPRSPLRDRIAELPTLLIGKTGALFTIGSSAIGGIDFLGSDAFLHCQGGFATWRPSDAKKNPPDNRDWQHLHAHYAKRRDYFLTWDGPLLELGAILEDGFPLGVMKPDTYLALREGRI